MAKLSREDYAHYIRVAPVLCVDVILRTPSGKYVLFKRENEPLKGEWWVVGGCVEQGEEVVCAAHRKLQEEIGTDQYMLNSSHIGYYEDFFEFSSVGRHKYHTVSLVFEATVDPKDIWLDSQHSAYKLVEELPKTFEVKR